MPCPVSASVRRYQAGLRQIEAWWNFLAATHGKPTMDRDEKDRAEARVIAAKLMLTAVPFLLLLALFALHRWIG